MIHSVCSRVGSKPAWKNSMQSSALAHQQHAATQHSAPRADVGTSGAVKLPPIVVEVHLVHAVVYECVAHEVDRVPCDASEPRLRAYKTKSRTLYLDFRRRIDVLRPKNDLAVARHGGQGAQGLPRGSVVLPAAVLAVKRGICNSPP